MATREELFLPDLPEPVSHYTHAVRANEFVFLSGFVASDKNGNIIGRGDPVAQTEAILDMMRTVLDQVGASLADVVKVTVYLTDVRYRQPINAARQAAFGDARPASTLVQVPSLYHPDAQVEIDSVALIPR